MKDKEFSNCKHVKETLMGPDICTQGDKPELAFNVREKYPTYRKSCAKYERKWWKVWAAK